jgi:membrane protease YdiL (CAAX protease family)
MFATALFILMAVGTWIWERGLSAEKRDKYHAEIESHDMVPRTRRDMVTFVALMLLLGAGWELLYRGYLMLVLAPLLGTTGAVIVAVVAYGAAHGYKTRGQFIASIVSAFLFTLGYVLTHSLWWLIVIHILLPLYGTASGYITLRAAGRLAPRPA